ncbi:IS3 family transposase [Paenibacillus chungangensis]|uniref:IS3 family transposase n=1 Tax=Paenibacillus chungangensis TaxID=696535 RepID=A0ABW3HNV5_9BACL
MIKKELIYLNKYATRSEAEKSIFEYIEVFYNNERIDSSIGYCTPTDFEQQYHFNTVNY